MNRQELFCPARFRGRRRLCSLVRKQCLNLVLLLLMLCSSLQAAWADDCGLEGADIRILANDFPALHAVTDELRQCEPAIKLTVNHTKDYRSLQDAALRVTPANYNIVMTGNNALAPLLDAQLVRPLDSLVAALGQTLRPEQLVRIDGKIMAIALLANAQHLFYREDIFNRAGLQPPTTVQQLLDACQVLQQQHDMPAPFAGAWQSGWNLALEFLNLYLATGQPLFKADGLRPALHNDAGRQTLNTMQALTECMSPEYLTRDINAIQSAWQAGELAMATLWGSRAAAVLDASRSTPEVVESTRFKVSPALGDAAADDAPAATLWWVGFAIPVNISAAEARDAFKAMLLASRPAMVRAHQEKAVWLLDGYNPAPAAAGIVASINANAPAYPMHATQHLLHQSLGAELADFFTGRESADTTLQDIEANYLTLLRESGYMGASSDQSD